MSLFEELKPLHVWSFVLKMIQTISYPNIYSFIFDHLIESFTFKHVAALYFQVNICLK